MAGVSRLQYATHTRLIRVMCSGRVDLAFILRAFSNGMDGVFIGGCRLNECNYITHGNYDALSTVHICRKIMEHLGLNPERVRIEFMSSGEGILFTEVMNDFAKNVMELGPLGTTEGIDENGLKAKLDAANKLVPYIKLVERERLRAPLKSEETYNRFFGSDEVNKVFKELIGDPLAITQIMALLRENTPVSNNEISQILGLNPTDVARHMNSSSKHGLVKYDENRKCFTPA